MKKLLALLLVLLLVGSLFGCVQPQLETNGSIPGTTATAPTLPTTAIPTDPTTVPTTTVPALPPIDEDGQYNSKEDVALYIHTYGHLPRNYVTKDYCKNVLKCSTSRVEDYWPGGAIGGDVFQNREGRLPSAPGRTWTECDINTWGKYARGRERIVFSNDGLVYYTADHYGTFTLLYGEP